jgi:hypothetical protein
MAKDVRDIRNSLHNSERHLKDTARSTEQSAQSNAATSQAARSAATGTWVGAGFQAATALQTARAARAAEEQLALQHVMAERQNELAEQITWNEFARWRQTPEGVAFLAWREPAFALAQTLRDRDSHWLQGWARAIGQAQAEIPDDEKQRLLRHPARLRQSGLKVASVVSFVLAGLFLLGLLVQLFALSVTDSAPAAGGFTYAECLVLLDDPENALVSEADCEAINPSAAGSVIPQVIPVALFLGFGVALAVVRTKKRRAARKDQTVENESRARVERWRFDPLAVEPGYAGFTWYESPRTEGYADRLMQLALFDGHGRPPAQSDLIAVEMPIARASHPTNPAELNQLLVEFGRGTLADKVR